MAKLAIDWPSSHSASRRWGGIFDVDGLERRLDHLNARTSAEGFWDDPDAAQKLVQERAQLAETTERFRTLSREVTDLLELLDMADRKSVV